MRVYVFVMLRERWFTQCLLAEDMQTSISGLRYFETFDTVIKALQYLGATEQELDELIERTEVVGRGSCFFTLLSGRKNLLGIKPAWLPPASQPSNAILDEARRET